ncbi:PP2C family protein-serine/threonine phosphatase [Streptomyces sp. NPDC015131]|uniref:PP2C family protein-serine/threonine phosphatase n=1 Tax=Streptomyces sp. NPDC015131 TaxID=3364941 RepID=UPI0036F766B3
MTSLEGPSRSAQGLLPDMGATWKRAPCPVLVVDAAGAIVEINARAAALFPDAACGALLADVAPAWLADAHRRTAARAQTRSGAGQDRPEDSGTYSVGVPRPTPAQPAAVIQRTGEPLPPTALRDGVDDPTAPVRGRHGQWALEAHATPGTDGHVVWWLVDDSGRSRAEAALKSEQDRTAFLADASSRLLASLNTERCMEVTVELAAEHLADAAVLVAPSSGRRHPLAVGVGVGGTVTHLTAKIDPSAVPGLAEALQGFPPVPSRWIDPAALPDWAVPAGLAGTVGSVVITPLPGHGVPAGALILLRRGDHAAFDASEEVFARVFAARAGAALSAARLYMEQRAITATLMAELLPPDLRHVHGVEFAGGYRASKDTDRVGGDFYDVHPGAGPEEETLAVLGDVCGKGLEAAVLTGKIRNTLQALLPLAGDHQHLLRLLNGALLNSHHTRFATLVLASVRRRSGTTHLRLTSAGHPVPLIVRGDGTVEEAETHGTLIGALPDVKATTAHIDLRPGETCLLFTDGITEARGGPLGDVMFGESRLKAALAECAGMPAEAVVERVQVLAAEWIGDNRHDDIAVMAITAPRTTHLTAVDGHTPGRYTA